jgi:integrase
MPAPCCTFSPATGARHRRPNVGQEQSMTRSPRAARWTPSGSFSEGERGIDRVRVFTHPKGGRLYLEWTDRDVTGRGIVRSQSLGRATRAQAEQAAMRKSAELRLELSAQPRGQWTVGTLFDIYETEVTPTKAPMTRQHDRRALRYFREHFGAGRDPMELTVRDWDSYIRARRSGWIRLANGARTRPVRNRAIEQDLRLLRAVLHWAKASRFLPDTPLDGLKPPTEKNPRRPVCTTEQYTALRTAAPAVHELLPLALVLAHETGHRVSAIRQLRWSDIDFDAGVVRWRAEHEKTKRSHETPLSRAALEILARHRAIGDAWLFPSARDDRQPITREVFDGWWDRAEKRAGLAPEPGRAWHSLRRKFGTELMHHPLKVVQELGGWKSSKVLMDCYQQPQMAMQRAALEQRVPLRAHGVGA